MPRACGFTRYVTTMKNLALAIALFVCLVPFSGMAATDIQFQAGEITFSLPDFWDGKGISPNRDPPKLDPTDPLFVSWKRAAVTGKNGNPISAGLNITVFNVQPDANLALASSSLMRRRGWPVKQFLTADKDELTLTNSLGYLTEFSPQVGLLLKVFVVHAINDGKFVEVNLSATDDIFPQVEPELRSVLKSLKLAR